MYAVETTVGVLGIYAVETTGDALKIQFVVFWGTEMKKLHDFPYLVNHRSYRLKLLDPSKWPQKWVYYGCFRYAYYSDNQKFKKCFFCMLFSWHYVIKFKKALFHKNYISYQIGWPFKMTGRTVFLLLFNTIYTSKTKGNGLKWEFPVFFWMRISGFLS